MDVLGDVAIELSTRRSRSLLMLISMALSVGSLIASVGISTTAQQQINADMAASTLNQVTVTVRTGSTDQTADESHFPADTEQRVTDLDLVAAAGLGLEFSSLAPAQVGRLAPADDDAKTVTVFAVTSGYVDAADEDATVTNAQLLDGELPVAIVGEDIAADLDLAPDINPTGVTIWVGDREFQVVGFTSGGKGMLSQSVLIPYAIGVATVGNDASAQLLVRTEPGAGAVIAPVLDDAIRPERPEEFATSLVVALSSLRLGVSDQLGRLVGWIGALLLVLTILVIANSLIVSVVSRTAEIGLRRALGSSRMNVASVFLSEGAVVGLLGGTGGSALGAAMTVITAAVNQWTPALSWPLVLAGPVLGAAVGILASIQPALSAAKISPAVAVRTD